MSDTIPDQQPPGVPFTPLTEYEEFFLVMAIADIQRYGEPATWEESEQRLEKVKKRTWHFWPLYYYLQHGIEMGAQFVNTNAGGGSGE